MTVSQEMPQPSTNIISLKIAHIKFYQNLPGASELKALFITIIGSCNGLSPERRQAIIWTNAGILLIGPLGTNFSEILIEIYAFAFKKIHLKISSGKWRPFCLGLNVVSHAIP